MAVAAAIPGDAQDGELGAEAKKDYSYAPVKPDEDAASDTYELGEVMERIGLRAYHMRVLLLSWVLHCCSAGVVMTTPFIMGPVREEYGVNRPTAAFVGSAVTVGSVAGTVIFGPLNDRFGRRVANQLAAVGIFWFSALHLALPAERGPEGQAHWLGFYALVALHVPLGVAFGGSAGYAKLLFVEFLPAQRRGLMMILSSVGWSIGTMFSIWIASRLEDRWRLVCASPAAACLVAVPFLLLSPESPRWLFTVGREQESKAVLGQLVATTRLLPPEVPAKSLESVPERVLLAHRGGLDEQEAGIWEDVKALFSPALWKVSLVTIAMQVGVNGGTYAAFWLPEILMMLLELKRIPYEVFLMAELVGWIAVAFTAWAMDSLGRRTTLTFSLLGTTATTAMLMLVPRTYGWLVSAMILQSYFRRGIYPAMQTYCFECFPTNVRGTGQSLCQSLGRLAAVFLPIWVGALLDGEGKGQDRPDLAVAMMVVTWLVGAVGAMCIPAETANLKMADS